MKAIKTAFLIAITISGNLLAKDLLPEETNAIVNEQGKILQYQKLLEAYSIKSAEELYKKPQTQFNRQLLPLPQNQSSTANTLTFVIHTITVKGNTLIPKRRIKHILADYEGKTMSKEDIVVLAKTLTNDYLKRGYVTSRITVPEQNLKTGVLELVAVEGRLEDIIMAKNKDDLQKKIASGKARRWSLSECMIFPWLEGDIVQLKDLEQGIDQLNRLRSCNGDMSILPSEKEGYSTIVILTNESEKKAWATIQADTGAFGANDFRPGTGFSIEDLIGLNESWYFNLSDEGTYKTNNTKSRIVSLSVPWGYWTLSGQYSKSAYLTRIKPISRYITNTGLSESYVLGVDRVIWRGTSSRTSVFAQYSGSGVESEVEDTINQASTFRLTVLRGGLNHSFGTSWGSFSASLGFHRGVSWGNAKTDPSDLADDEPHARFEKYVVAGSFYRPSIWRHWPVSFRTNAQVQYAKKSLYSSERLGIGGVFSIRGTSESLSGERGILIRNDLSTPLSAFWDIPVIRNHTVGLNLDGGCVWTKDRYSTYTRGGAIGTGLSLNGRRNNTWWGVSYSLPIYVSSALKKEAGQVNANLGFEF